MTPHNMTKKMVVFFVFKILLIREIICRFFSSIIFVSLVIEKAISIRFFFIEVVRIIITSMVTNERD